MRRFPLAVLLFLTVVVSCVAAPSACDAVSGNLVQNCGFESGCGGGCPFGGPFPDWSLTRAATGSYTGICSNGSCTVQDAHSGSYGYYFGARSSSSDDVISQVLSTTAGATYQLTFWVYSMGMDANSDFHAAWDGTTVYTAPIPAAFAFTQISLTEVATGNDTLSFGGRGPNGNDWGLDDIVVTQQASPVPETSSILLLGTVLLALAAIFRRVHARKRSEVS